MQHALNRACHGFRVDEKAFKFALPNQTLRLSITVALDCLGMDDSSLESDDRPDDIAKLTLMPHGKCMNSSLDLQATRPSLMDSIKLDAMTVTPCTMYDETPRGDAMCLQESL
eukprot:TRINITY_DN16244_c0_g1_i2.p2 TRINITY_DN16244_c0_g1~~TRINITY_DN16244_c0_g1_i2.p2  ORF type:complete len:113 (-),score=24.02 TRINITY_DN16244_c0_g1_i2:210-548(-)